MTTDKPPVAFPAWFWLLISAALLAAGALDFLKGPTIAALVAILPLAIYSISNIISIRRTSPQEVTQKTVDHVLGFMFASFFLCSILGARFEPRRFFFPLWLAVYGLVLLYANLKQQGKPYLLSIIVAFFVSSALGFIFPQWLTLGPEAFWAALALVLLLLVIGIARSIKTRGQPQPGWRWW